jgi:hypothetical protein
MEETNKPKHTVRNVAIVAVILAIIAGVAFYFFYWLKTPQYSLQIIREAVQKHDAATFEKHVDVNNLNSRAIDVMVTSTIAPDDAQNPLLESMLVMVKNAALPHFNSQMRTYVETGSFSDAHKDEEGRQIAEAAAVRTGLTNLVFKSIQDIEQKDDRAVITCTVQDTKLQKDFVVKLLMQRLPDRTWRLEEIANLGDFMIAHDDAVQEKLNKLNEPISAEINKKVAVIKDGTKVYNIARVDSKLSGTKVSEVQADFSFKLLDPQVVGVQGNIEFYDAQNQVIYSRAFDSAGKDLSAQKNGIWSFADSWRLNSFDAMDKKLLDADISTIKSGVVFTGVTMKDGKKIEFLTQLPK